MTHGTPDYGHTNALRTTYQMDDAGELAVRLGSPVSFDRRGDVMWWDDFECSLNKWTASQIGTGASVAISAVRARNGGNSCLLIGGSDGAGSASILHADPPPVISRFGVELSFDLPTDVGVVFLRMDLFNGAQHYRAGAKFDKVANKVQYESGIDVYTDLDTLPAVLYTTQLFHTLKVVIDGVAGTYVRILLDNKTYDLSAVNMFSLADNTPAQLLTDITCLSRAGFNDSAYIDDVIITQNEP